MLADLRRVAKKVPEVLVFTGGWGALLARAGKVATSHGLSGLWKKAIAISSGASAQLGDLKYGATDVVLHNGVAVSPIKARYRATCAELTVRLMASKKAAKRPQAGPLISILTPVYNSPIEFLKRAVNSVRNQTYINWELCLVDDGSSNPVVWPTLVEFSRLDNRIKIASLDSNGGISAATNAALSIATGTYIGLLDHDDMLTIDALEVVAAHIENNLYPDFLYSDEFKIDEHDQVDELFCKPDWSPFNLLNQMYTGHFSVYKRSVIDIVGGFRSKFDFSQDYDLALRVAELSPSVVHIEDYLYGWRKIAGSAAMGGKLDARVSNIAALQSAADRRQWSGVAIPLPTANRLVRTASVTDTISIIIPSDDRLNIEATIKSITSQSSYNKYEIVIVTNSEIINSISQNLDEKIKWCVYDKQYNFSDKCNLGASVSNGNYLIFLNDDVRIISADWMESILECATLPGVGAVGPKLLYEDCSIQHAGMVTGVRRFVGTAFHSFPRDTSAHFNFAQNIREVSLICGACIAISRSIFQNVGGFNAKDTPINHSDVDLCCRIMEQGLKCVYTPHAELFHIGHASIGKVEKKAPKNTRKKDKADIFLMQKWSHRINRDPYFTRAMRDILYIDSQELFSYSPPNVHIKKSGKDILIISHDLTASGAPKVVFDMAQAFIKRGDFVVIVSPMDGVFHERLTRIGAHVIIDPLVLRGHNWTLDFGRNFDVVIANTIVCWPAVIQLGVETDLYWYIHESERVGELAEMEPAILQAFAVAKSVWVGSERAAQALRKYGVAPEIYPYGVDDISGVIAPERTIRVGLFGSLEPRKGQDLAALGFIELPADLKSRSELNLYGRTLDEGFADAIHKFSQAEPAILLRGPLNHEQYLQAMNSTDIVVVPSRDDTLPLVSLDALALGKPLVCSATTGTSAYVEDWVSGVVLKHNSPREIADVLATLISDEELRFKIGLAGQAVYKANFTRAAFENSLFAAVGLNDKDERRH